ncbi:hypothetical protein [Kangiella marina]|uniref:Ankyrin repeat domain-containing protein n=1 Tax=Kangiella marina TaxID=1079178 RepID=A0ABP8IDI4_9GAMM
MKEIMYIVILAAISLATLPVCSKGNKNLGNNELVGEVESNCDKYSKDELFQKLMDSYSSKDLKRYSTTISCFRSQTSNDEEFIPIFYLVAYSDDDSYVLEVIESINNINLKLPTEEYIIHFATEKGSMKLVERIIELGGNANVKSDFNLMPIDIAIQKDLGLFELLLKNTKLNRRDSKNLVSSIIMHSNRNKFAMVELLLKSDNFYKDKELLDYMEYISSLRGYNDILGLVKGYNSN